MLRWQTGDKFKMFDTVNSEEGGTEESNLLEWSLVVSFLKAIKEKPDFICDSCQKRYYASEEKVYKITLAGNKMESCFIYRAKIAKHLLASSARGRPNFTSKKP